MKNKHNLQRIIGVVIIAIGILIFVLIGKSENGSEIAAYAGVACLAIGFIWYSIATSNSRKICDECGSSLAGCSYEYQEIKREASTNTEGYTVFVHINATCPNCGAVKSFDKKFYCKLEENPQFRVDQFCRNHFGH